MRFRLVAQSMTLDEGQIFTEFCATSLGGNNG